MTEISSAVHRIRAWGEACDWEGYDPYDGLTSPLAALLPGALPRRLLTQAVKLSPVNIRPLLGIRPAWNQKAIGLVASAYARLAAAEADDAARREAERWLGWLTQNHANGTPHAWGYHFPVRTRVLSYPANAQNTIATAFVAHAFLDGAELLGDERWLEHARGTACYLVKELLTVGDRPYFRYLPHADDLIHNANVLACAVCARVIRLGAGDGLAEPVLAALETTLTAQRADGSWPYAEDSPHDWVDNFHTGYVLESLAACVELSTAARPALERGLAFWSGALFLPDGTPRFFADKTVPLDAHNYAQAVETWVAVSPWTVEGLRRAREAADLLIERMLAPSGYVYFQQRRFWTNKVPLVRWSTAPSFRALAGLKLAEKDQTSRETETVLARMD